MSKRPPYEIAEDPSGRKYWRSLAELEQKPELLAQLPAEFPPNITEPPDGMSRRDFFNLMGASAALAGLAACRSPDEKILPYAVAPEEQIPGAPLYYATATTFAGARAVWCGHGLPFVRLCTSDAADRSAVVVVRQRSSSPSRPSRFQQPWPSEAHVSRHDAGSSTTPTTTRPASIRPTMTENWPFFWAKPRVPSIGSMIHNRSPVAGTP